MSRVIEVPIRAAIDTRLDGWKVATLATGAWVLNNATDAGSVPIVDADLSELFRIPRLPAEASSAAEPFASAHLEAGLWAWLRWPTLRVGKLGSNEVVATFVLASPLPDCEVGSDCAFSPDGRVLWFVEPSRREPDSFLVCRLDLERAHLETVGALQADEGWLRLKPLSSHELWIEHEAGQNSGCGWLATIGDRPAVRELPIADWKFDVSPDRTRCLGGEGDVHLWTWPALDVLASVELPGGQHAGFFVDDDLAIVVTNDGRYLLLATEPLHVAAQLVLDADRKWTYLAHHGGVVLAHAGYATVATFDVRAAIHGGDADHVVLERDVSAPTNWIHRSRSTKP